MTPVLFHFVTTNGAPISFAKVQIRLTRSDFDEVESGVYMPRLIETTTGMDGKILQNLMPCSSRYHVTVYDPLSDVALHYHFYVPTLANPEDVARFQDLIVDDNEVQVGVAYDEAAMALILSAKATAMSSRDTAVSSAVDAQASKVSAAASALLAANSATTAVNAATEVNSHLDEAIQLKDEVLVISATLDEGIISLTDALISIEADLGSSTENALNALIKADQAQQSADSAAISVGDANAAKTASQAAATLAVESVASTIELAADALQAYNDAVAQATIANAAAAAALFDANRVSGLTSTINTLVAEAEVTENALTVLGLEKVAVSDISATSGAGIPGYDPTINYPPNSVGAVIRALQTAQSAGVIGKDTQANLYADLNYAANTVAYVLLDPTAANNNTYIKQGGVGTGSWLPANSSPVTVLSAKVDANTAAVALNQGAIEGLKKSAFSSSYDDVMPFVVADKNGQPILGVRPDGVVHAILDKLPGLSMLDAEFAYANCDVDGYVISGIRWDGTVYPTPSVVQEEEFTNKMPGLLMLDARFVHAICDVDGYVIFGIQWDGELYFSGVTQDNVSKSFVYNDDLWAIAADAKPVQVTEAVKVTAPVVTGGSIDYLASVNGGFVAATTPIPSSNAWAAFVTKVVHLLASGQSLSMGSGSTLATVNPQCANRLRTLQSGVRTASQDAVLLNSDCLPLKPLVGNASECPIVQHAFQLQRNNAIPYGAGVVASVHGRGGQTIASLSKGGQYYNNSMVAVTQVHADAVASGLSYMVPYIDFIQGEANVSNAPGVYAAQALTLQSDYENDIKAISGQSGNIPILWDQISNFTAYGYASSNVPHEQLSLALLHPTKFVCAGPKYHLLTNSDGIHLPTLSSRRTGAQHARAAEAILKGLEWFPTHCTSAVRNGNVVTLKFYTPYGRLVKDTVNVSDPGNLGIHFEDSTDSAVVTAVKVNLDNTVSVTLSAVPTGANPVIGIADNGVPDANGGPFTGARACLHDSSTDKCGDGLPVYNWACHQRINVV